MTQHAVEVDRWISAFLPKLAGKRILDVGCGRGSVGLLLRQAEGGLDADIVAVEVFAPNVEFVRRFNLYNEVWEGDITVCGDLGQFDVIVAIEVLEHLRRPEGDQLLARLEASATDRVIVSTPNGADLRPGVGGNQAEAHLSAWTVSDFRSRGYEVVGVGSRLHRSQRQSRLTALAWSLSTPFGSRWPAISGNIIAMRRSPGGR